MHGVDGGGINAINTHLSLVASLCCGLHGKYCEFNQLSLNITIYWALINSNLIKCLLIVLAVAPTVVSLLLLADKYNPDSVTH